MAAQGVRPGVPDLLIFDPPPNCPGKCGTALEMKTAKFTESQLRRSQRIWLADLADRNWISLVGHGAEHAIAQLQELGYSL